MSQAELRAGVKAGVMSHENHDSWCLLHLSSSHPAKTSENHCEGEILGNHHCTNLDKVIKVESLPSQISQGAHLSEPSLLDMYSESTTLRQHLTNIHILVKTKEIGVGLSVCPYCNSLT